MWPSPRALSRACNPSKVSWSSNSTRFSAPLGSLMRSTIAVQYAVHTHAHMHTHSISSTRVHMSQQ